jgi:hypothetical protein
MTTTNIEFEVEVDPTTEHVNDEGEYVFGIYATNVCNDDIEKAIQSVAELWEAQYLEADVNLTINVRVRSLYEYLHNMRTANGRFDAESKPLFEALKNDCQWIVDQINKLEVIK